MTRARRIVIAPATAVCLAAVGTIPSQPATAGASETSAMTAAGPTRGASGSAARAARAARPNPARLTFYVGLRRDDAAADRLLRAVSDPRSRGYRRFPSRRQIRERFGVSRGDFAVLRRSARRAGLVAKLDPTGAFARVSGTRARLRKWIGEPIRHWNNADGSRTFYTGGRAPRSIRRVTREWIPAFTVMSNLGARLEAQGGPIWGNTGTYVEGCRQAREQNTYSFKQLNTAYGLTRLSHEPTTGRKTRLAIIAQGSGFTRRALDMSAACFQLQRKSFHRVPVDGLRGPLPEGSEGNLDTQVAQAALAADARVNVIEQSGYDPNSFLAWARAFSLKPMPDVLTTSYGDCEPARIGPGIWGTGQRLMNDAILLRLALAGASAFAAAGDSGSSDCYENGQGHKYPTVDYPASSPYMTAVGGSRIVLNRRNHRADEVVWRNVGRYGPPGPPVEYPTGGCGGGVSRIYRAPWWQRRPVTRSARRSVPDLVAHASFGPAWAISSLVQGGGRAMQGVAGTSAATPYVASAVATMVAQERRRGRPALGLVAPLLYLLHGRHPGVLYDITHGSNDIYGVGCCRAGPGYDRASGLGAPNLARLYKWIPAPGRR